MTQANRNASMHLFWVCFEPLWFRNFLLNAAVQRGPSLGSGSSGRRCRRSSCKVRGLRSSNELGESHFEMYLMPVVAPRVNEMSASTLNIDTPCRKLCTPRPEITRGHATRICDQRGPETRLQGHAAKPCPSTAAVNP